MKKIGVLIAVKDEASKILSDHEYQWTHLDNGAYFSNKYSIKLVITGIGKVYSAYKLSKIIDDSDVILVMGTSGGLNNEKIGDIYLVKDFIEHDMDVTGLGFKLGLTPFSSMKEPLISNITEKTYSFFSDVLKSLNIQFKTGRIISGDSFIHDPQITIKKRELFEADLVDMETAGVAKICATVENKEIVAIRYITDNANHESAGNWLDNVEKSSIIFNDILKKALTMRDEV